MSTPKNIIKKKRRTQAMKKSHFHLLSLKDYGTTVTMPDTNSHMQEQHKTKQKRKMGNKQTSDQPFIRTNTDAGSTATADFKQKSTTFSSVGQLKKQFLMYKQDGQGCTFNSIKHIKCKIGFHWMTYQQQQYFAMKTLQ